MEQKNKKNTDFYQDLPSIKPRVSREERLSMRGNFCPECSAETLKNAHNQTRLSYHFFLFLVVLLFAVLWYYDNINQQKPVYSLHQATYVFDRNTASLSLIKQENRHGILILLRNNTEKKWAINTIALSNTFFSTNSNINISISAKQVFTEFIAIPKEIVDLDDMVFQIN